MVCSKEIGGHGVMTQDSHMCIYLNVTMFYACVHVCVRYQEEG